MPELAIDELVDRVGFVDPASGKNQELKKVRARSAIVVVGQDALARIFVLYAWADRVSPTVLSAKIIEVADALKPRTFGIEDNAMQFLFADLVMRDARQLESRVKFLPVTQPTRIEKDFRIRTTLQPVIARGRLFVRADQRELLQEIEAFPNSMTKDVVDALASAVNILPRRVAPVQRRDEAEALARYLRESGAPPDYIEQRLAELAHG